MLPTRHRLAAAVVVGCSGLACAQPSFEPLGIPAGYASSRGLAVSADGLTVTGSAQTATSSVRGWWWRAGNMTFLPGTAVGAAASPFGIAPDGGTIVGTAGLSDGGFRFRTATSTIELLPYVGAVGRLLPRDVSADGEYLVGGFAGTTIPSRTVPAVWSQAGGHVMLPMPPALPPFTAPDQGLASAVTPDRSVVVGSAWAFANGAGPAFRWTAATGSQSLGFLVAQPLSPPKSGATGVSDDGSVVVGWSDSDESGRRAFRWTQATGMVNIGAVPGATIMSANAVNADGSVIVGDTNLAFAQSRAFIWDAASGPRDLREVLLAAGSSGPLLNWTLNTAQAISADGKTIVGSGTDELGRTQAYIARMVPPPCYPNCDGSSVPPLLNVNDFACFLNRYAAGDSYANCDGSTQPPVLNVGDFQCFINQYAAGC